MDGIIAFDSYFNLTKKVISLASFNKILWKFCSSLLIGATLYNAGLIALVSAVWPCIFAVPSNCGCKNRHTVSKRIYFKRTLLGSNHSQTFCCNYPHIDFAFVDFVMTLFILASSQILTWLTDWRKQKTSLFNTPGPLKGSSAGATALREDSGMM